MYSSAEDDDCKHNRTVKPKTTTKIKPRSSKVAKTTRTQPILSPKTKKLNEVFDKLKDSVVNDEKITLVKKKSSEKGLLYNLSSESEDGDFKQKNKEILKRSASSFESTATKRRRLMSRVNYNSPEDEDKRTQKSKIVKQAKPRSRKTNKIPKLNIIDERVRAAQQETLETSFVKDIMDTNNLEEPEPALQQASVLEDMPPDTSNDEEAEVLLLENKKKSPKKWPISKIKKESKLSKTCEAVTRSIATNKSKEITKIISEETDSAPVSPLPNLVVETEKTRQDDLSFSIEGNLLQECIRIFMNVDDLNQTDDTRHLLLNADENDDAVLEPTEIILGSDELSERSIATGGPSPIIGHNDLNESPPKDCKHNRTVKPKTTQPILSPKTKKLNEMFVKLKGVVNDEKITLVKKKGSEKGLLYNLSSESEDGDFKQKNKEILKRSASSFESTATKRRRLMSRVNYNSPEDEDKRTQKSKIVKQAKPRSRKTNKIPKLNIIDERVRAAQQETLETSFVKDTMDTNNLEEPEPALQQAPVLEDMSPDTSNDEEAEVLLQFSHENDDAVLEPTETILGSDELSERSIATGGPSPIIGHNDLNESPPNVELLDEDFQHRDVHVEGMSESMVEFINNMRIRLQTNKPLSIIEESIHKSNQTNPKVVLERIPSIEIESKLDPIGTPKSKISSVVPSRTSALPSSPSAEPEPALQQAPVLEDMSPDTSNDEEAEVLLQFSHENDDAVLEPTETILGSDELSERSIATGGPSPIIGHNDLNESPPNVELLDEDFQHRDVHVEGMSESMVEFINNMRILLQTNKPLSIIEESIHKSNQTNPKVVLERIPSIEIESKLDPIGTPKSKISSVVPSRTSALPSSPSAADNHTYKEIICQVMETVQTRLAETERAAAKRFTAASLKYQEEITCLEKEVQRVLKKIEELKKNQMDRTHELIRADAKQNARMVMLLQEDIQRHLN